MSYVYRRTWGCVLRSDYWLDCLSDTATAIRRSLDFGSHRASGNHRGSDISGSLPRRRDLRLVRGWPVHRLFRLFCGERESAWQTGNAVLGAGAAYPDNDNAPVGDISPRAFN